MTGRIVTDEIKALFFASVFFFSVERQINNIQEKITYEDCYRYTTNYIRRFLKIFDNVTDLDDGKKKPCYEINVTDEDYDRVDAVIEKLNLTEKQRQVLELYISNERLTDISIELNISCSQVCNTRNSIQKRYLKRIGQLQF